MGIEKKIGSRLNSASLGYSKESRQHVEDDEVLSYITPSDLKSYGLIPELIGRMPIVTFMSPLDKKALTRHFDLAEECVNQAVPAPLSYGRHRVVI